ncbi:MAG: hypothetical protein SGPRY_005565, partial [Prymnesium sp.]
HHRLVHLGEAMLIVSLPHLVCKMVGVLAKAEGWREYLRSLGRMEYEYCAFWFLDTHEAMAFGHIFRQCVRRVMDHNNPEAQILLALLPQLLLSCRRITHNGRNLSIERCQQVLELPDARMSEYSRAGKALLRQEVARGTESTLAALDRLHPDGATALEVLRSDFQEGELPAPTPLDLCIFMHTIGADETGLVKRGYAADATGWRWEHFAWRTLHKCIRL